jgi:hypothetical protein
MTTRWPITLSAGAKPWQRKKRGHNAVYHSLAVVGRIVAKVFCQASVVETDVRLILYCFLLSLVPIMSSLFPLPRLCTCTKRNRPPGREKIKNENELERESENDEEDKSREKIKTRK